MKILQILLTQDGSRNLRQLSKDLCMGPAEVLEELLSMPFGLIPGKKKSTIFGGPSTLYQYKEVKHKLALVDYRYKELVQRSSAAGISKSDYCMLLIKMLGPLALKRSK